jgi:hypothetical protein
VEVLRHRKEKGMQAERGWVIEWGAHGMAPGRGGKRPPFNDVACVAHLVRCP